ncbi:uncharacterized protein LOC121374391 [Gigantopelta aegis]|uniref:uncharacterized protein LOC121374391 n=1 Tax=Gigantopelta aegis TaxID=1735272 RepID=UPI001B88C589|nr:uncharacterized protein LOC121374391 [Gigantopelta aegis]
MQSVYIVAVYILGHVVVQCTAHEANITKRQAATSKRLVHSPLLSQNMYPNNPIMLEAPSHFATPGRLLKPYSIEEYLAGGYSKWGGYEREMFQPDGSVILEFDMKISRQEYVAYYSGNDMPLVQSSPPLDSPIPNRKPSPTTKMRFKRKALRLANTRWPGGIVPYDISIDFTQREAEIVKRSMKAWGERTCIRFVPTRPYHQNVLRVQSERGCNSFVGMVGGAQQLNLERDCRVEHVITHELGHVIGLIHEHQRTDRDKYINILPDNVGFNKLKNFRKFLPERVSNFGVEYDYTSIMHYGKNAFSKDDKSVTMVTVDHRFQDIIGHATAISFSDAKTVNLMYNCAKACRSVAVSCGKGYMDHNCHCVCQDGTKSCIKKVMQRTRGNLIHRNTGQRIIPQPNVFFPGIGSPIIQSPSLFRNIFLPTSRNVGRPLQSFRNLFPPSAQRYFRQNPNLFRQIIGRVAQKPTVQRPATRNRFYQPAIFYPISKFATTPAGRPMQFSGNQRVYPQSGSRFLMFPNQQVQLLPRIRREPVTNSNRRFDHRVGRRGISSHSNIDMRPGYSHASQH